MNVKLKYAEILTKEFLEEEHKVKGKTTSAIAKQIGCDPWTVNSWLDRHGIERNPYNSRSHGRMGATCGRWKGHGDIPATYWNNVRNNARSRGIHHNIKIEDAWELLVNQNKICKLTGQPIGFEKSQSYTASMDRIDSSKGYILSNVQWVHRDVNFAKQSLSTEEFISLCKHVVDHSSKSRIINRNQLCHH
jgi:hypothetical protein